MRDRPEVTVRAATVADAGELLTLQLAAFVSEAQQYGDPLIAPLREGLAGVERAVSDPTRTVLTAQAQVTGAHGRAGRLLGSAQLRVVPPQHRVGLVGRVVTAPDVQGLGLGSLLLTSLHAVADRLDQLERLELVTGADSQRNLDFYRRHGYVDAEVTTDDRGVRLQVMHRDLPRPTASAAAPDRA